MKNKQNFKNKLIMCLIGAIIGTIKMPIILSIENAKQGSFWRTALYIVGYYIIFRCLLRLIQKIMIKRKIMKYKSDNFSYYNEKWERESKEQFNIEYKQGMDRFWGRLCYMVCYLIAFIIAEIAVGESIGGAILIVFIFNIPLVIASKPPIDMTYYNPNSSASIQPDHKEEKTNEFKFGKAYFKDKFGNITGSADTVTYNGKYGSYEKTEYKDNFGNVIGKKDKYKF